MIALASQTGSLIRLIPERTSATFIYHSVFGVLSEEAFQERLQSRRRGHLRADVGNELARFTLTSEFELEAGPGCGITRLNDAAWKIEAANGLTLLLTRSAAEAVLDERRLGYAIPKEDDRKVYGSILGSGLLMILLLFLFPRAQVEKPEELPVIEPVAVKVIQEKKKAVIIPEAIIGAPVPKELAKASEQVKRAIRDDLGFMGMIGSKDLKKALGGPTTKLKDASPGAGPGGTEGSGGEMLVGLGKGLKRTTVGNSGVAGLGGIGTKGAGGGGGGYGTEWVGSGEGKAFSAMPVSKDIVLEGGLSRSVIQAAIAKYLNQVRACYEKGLEVKPGIQGTVTMSFEISGEGNMNYSRVKGSTLGDDSVEDCIAAKMMGWKFPKPLGGVNVKVVFPFLLRPVGT